MKPGKSARYGLNSLASNILCKRHNSAIANLDSHASLLFRDLRDAQHHAAESEDGSVKSYLYSGDALEQWAAKTMLGLYYSNSLGMEGKSIKGLIDFDEKVVAKTIFGSTLPAPLGMRITTAPGDILQQNVRVAPITPESAEILSGIHISIRGISFQFITNADNIGSSYFENVLTYRPWIIDFIGKKSRSRIFLTWKFERTNLRHLRFQIGVEESASTLGR